MRCTLLWLTISGLAAAQTNQTSPNFGSVPSGTASSEVLHLTLRDAIIRALRYNLGQIESGENARIARGQRLRALSALLPQVSAGSSESVQQLRHSVYFRGGVRCPVCLFTPRDICIAFVLAGGWHASVARAAHKFLEECGYMGWIDIHRWYINSAVVIAQALECARVQVRRPGTQRLCLKTIAGALGFMRDRNEAVAPTMHARSPL